MTTPTIRDPVEARFESGRARIWLPKKIPAVAYSSHQCDGEWVVTRQQTFQTPGTLCVEFLRDEEVLTSILLPNGYVCPTGRGAPEDCWFGMLKHHLRSWLSVSPEGRLFRLCSQAISQIENDLQALKTTEPAHALMLRAAEHLREVRNQIADLPSSTREADILKNFYAWLTTTSEGLGVSQRDVMQIVRKARDPEPEVAEELDLDPKVFSSERVRRCLAI